MKEIVILGIHVKQRSKQSVALQNLLTKYGCSIKTRLGIHEVVGDYCSNEGIILLELTGDKAEMDNLEKELKQLSEIEVQKMVFKQQ